MKRFAVASFLTVAMSLALAACRERTQPAAAPKVPAEPLADAAEPGDVLSGESAGAGGVRAEPASAPAPARAEPVGHKRDAEPVGGPKDAEPVGGD